MCEAVTRLGIASVTLALPDIFMILSAASEAAEPMEYGRILGEEDFARIKRLRHKALVERVMAKHGLKSVRKHDKLLAAAHEEADEALAKQVRIFILINPAPEQLLI